MMAGWQRQRRLFRSYVGTVTDYGTTQEPNGFTRIAFAF